MGTGAKIAIGCGCIVLLGAAAVVGVVGMGAWWAKGKLTEATGGLDKIAAKAERDQTAGRRRRTPTPTHRPPTASSPRPASLKFLETRKRVYSVYERYEAELRALQKKAEAAGDKLVALGPLVGRREGRRGLQRDPPGADEGAGRRWG